MARDVTLLDLVTAIAASAGSTPGVREGRVPGEHWRGSSVRDLSRCTVRRGCVRNRPARLTDENRFGHRLRPGTCDRGVGESRRPVECSVEEFSSAGVADSDWVRDWVLIFNALTLSRRACLRSVEKTRGNALGQKPLLRKSGGRDRLDSQSSERRELCEFGRARGATWCGERERVNADRRDRGRS